MGEGTAEEIAPAVTTDAEAQPQETTEVTSATPAVEGRRTQLKIVRENIATLSNDIGSFRSRHEKSVRKLEKQIDSLRNDLAPKTLSKDVEGLRKSHNASTKRLEKQVSTLRNELAALKSSMARDAARSRAKQEAQLSKILAKLSKPAAKSKPKPAKTKKK